MTVKIKVDNRTHEILKIVGDIGPIAQNRAADLLRLHRVKHTWRYRFKCFIKNCRRMMSTMVDDAATIAYSPRHQSGDKHNA
jgi:hypothetical protein